MKIPRIGGNDSQPLLVGPLLRASPVLGEAGTTDAGSRLATHQVLLKVYISLSPESCAMMQSSIIHFIDEETGGIVFPWLR